MIYILFVLAVLSSIAVAGIISGSETAITSASKGYLYHLAKKGSKEAKQVLSLQENISETVGTILVMNQLILYFIPIGSTLFAINYFSAAEATIVQMIIAVVIVIYAEIFPKMLALRFTIKFALFVAPGLNYLVKIFKPLITVLQFCAKITLRVIGVKNEQESNLADEELRGAIEMRSDNGDEGEAQKKSMLKSILDLEEIYVNQTMVHRKNLKTIDISLPVQKIAEELTNCPFSRVPLWKDNPENIVGILKTKTFFRELQLQNGNMDKIKINNLISTPWYIPETTHLLDQLQNFKKKREHFALVVDEYGDLLGCITLEDILEEIVGEIVDEYDTNTEGINLQHDGSIIADGSTSIRDLNKQFNLNIPEEEASTIAGYVMHELRKIPDVGQIYVFSSVKIEILRRSGNQIGLVRITPPTEAQECDVI